MNINININIKSFHYFYFITYDYLKLYCIVYIVILSSIYFDAPFNSIHKSTLDISC